MMLAGQAGVRNLEGVKNSQVDQCRQIWQLARNTHEPDQTLLAKALEQINQSFTLERFGVAAVKLQDIDVVGLQSLQTQLEISLDDFLSPLVVDFEMVFVLSVDAATLGREREFVSARTDVATDSLLTDPVVGGRVDKVDTGIQHIIQELLGRPVVDHTDSPSSRTAQSHAPVAKLCDLQTGAAQRFLTQHDLSPF